MMESEGSFNDSLQSNNHNGSEVSARKHLQKNQVLDRGKYTVYLSYVSLSGQVYVHLPEDWEKLQSICITANRNHFDHLATPPSAGTLCLAQFCGDGALYRARILSIEKSTAKVYFVDYGNTERTDISNLRTIDEDMMTAEALAVPCLLNKRKHTADDALKLCFMAQASSKLKIEVIAFEEGFHIVNVCPQRPAFRESSLVTRSTPVKRRRIIIRKGCTPERFIIEATQQLSRNGLSTTGIPIVLRKRLENVLYNHRPRAEPAFDYILVIDFEATCDTDNSNYLQEIIEFPVVVIDCKRPDWVDTYQSYVKPVINPTLTKYCIELTGISQDMVNVADRFSVVLDRVWTWLKSKGYHQRCAILTHGSSDISCFLHMQCLYSAVPFPQWAREWIDLKKTFSDHFGCQRLPVMTMLQILGMEFEGRPHCGLDDARNIARIALQLYQDGCDLAVNDSLDKNYNFTI